MERRRRCFIVKLVFCLVFMGISSISLKTAHALDTANTTEYLVNKARQKRLLLIGTIHKNPYIHHVITGALPSLSKDANASVLFVEVATSQQHNIDQYSSGSLDIGKIKISEVVSSPCYLELLREAKGLGMKIVAIDTEIPSPVSRDEWMAKNVNAYLSSHPKDKGIVVVGARHALKGIEWMGVKAPSLADYLGKYDEFSIIPWPDADQHIVPVATDFTSVKFSETAMPLLNAMNINQGTSLLTAADGIIFLPKVQEAVMASLHKPLQ